MGVNAPDLDGNFPVPPGNKAGVPGGTQTAVSQAAMGASPLSPAKAVQQIWQPRSFMDFHSRLDSDPADASRDLHQAISTVYQSISTLQSMIASTQSGKATVTGSAVGIPTGLQSVKNATATIDNGSTAHNLWVSVVVSKTPGAIDIYVWKPTAAGNNTPIANTTAIAVRWTASGGLS